MGVCGGGRCQSAYFSCRWHLCLNFSETHKIRTSRALLFCCVQRSSLLIFDFYSRPPPSADTFSRAHLSVFVCLFVLREWFFLLLCSMCVIACAAHHALWCSSSHTRFIDGLDPRPVLRHIFSTSAKWLMTAGERIKFICRFNVPLRRHKCGPCRRKYEHDGFYTSKKCIYHQSFGAYVHWAE